MTFVQVFEHDSRESGHSFGLKGMNDFFPNTFFVVGFVGRSQGVTGFWLLISLVEWKVSNT